MGRIDFDPPFRVGVDPGLSGAATRKDERVHLPILDDGKAEIPINRHIRSGFDGMPHGV